MLGGMKYTVHSKMCIGPRAIAWFIGLIGYLGLLIAPSVVFSIPFQLFHRTHASPLAFWLTAFAVFLLAFWIAYRLALSGYRSFVQKVLDLDAVIGLVGIVLALPVIICVYPPR
jgi:hypothetical protein